MFRAFKYRLKPNVNQTRELGITLETLRRLYNEALALKKAAWEEEQKTLTFADLSRWYTDASKANPWYQRLNRKTAESILRRLDKAFKAFFRRVKAGEKPGYPRFKGRDHFDSFAYESANNGYKLLSDRLRLRLQYIGDVRIKMHRPIEGKIKTVAIKREADKWYVVFACDLGEVAIPPSTNPKVGIDVGIESFLTTSDGEHVENPKYLKNALPELRRKQRALSRKKKGSKKRRKARKRVAKLHARIKNQRKEHAHQVANSLVRRYGLVAVENLNIKGMLRNDRLARAISDVAWGNFLLTLKSKAESAGVSYVEVDARGTSQLCSGCGREVPKDLSVRWHHCPHCGLSIHRDHNSARAVLSRAVTGRIGPAELNVADCRKRAPGSVSPRPILITDPPSSCPPRPKKQRNLNVAKAVDAAEQPARCVIATNPVPAKDLSQLRFQWDECPTEIGARSLKTRSGKRGAARR